MQNNELLKLIRHEQYYSKLSVEEVVFNDKEFYQSLAKYQLCCKLLNEDENKYTLDELRQFL